MVSFLVAITSAPTTLTELPANASFLAFSPKWLFKNPRGKSITNPASDYRIIIISENKKY